MQRRPSRPLPIPHIFMGVSIALLLSLFIIAAMSRPATAEAVEGNGTDTVTEEGGSWLTTSWTSQTSTSEAVASRSHALPNLIPRGVAPCR